jgi:hypothetical protein
MLFYVMTVQNIISNDLYCVLSVPLVFFQPILKYSSVNVLSKLCMTKPSTLITIALVCILQRLSTAGIEAGTYKVNVQTKHSMALTHVTRNQAYPMYNTKLSRFL